MVTKHQESSTEARKAQGVRKKAALFRFDNYLLINYFAGMKIRQAHIARFFPICRLFCCFACHVALLIIRIS